MIRRRGGVKMSPAEMEDLLLIRSTSLVPYRATEKKSAENSIHHRHPRSTGGSNNTRNLISLNRVKHDLWHRFAFNLWPDEIAEKITVYFTADNIIYRSRFIGTGKERLEGRTPSSYMIENRSKYPTNRQYEAWCSLFGGLSAKEITEIINESFIDPDYELFVEEITS